MSRRQDDLDGPDLEVPTQDTVPFIVRSYASQPAGRSFVVALPQQHPLSQYETINSKQLNDENVLLLGEGHCFRDQVLAACPNLNQQQQTGLIEGSSLETLKYMVASGLGISILPASASQLAESNAASSFTTRAFTKNSPTRSVAVAWRASFPRPQAIDALCDAVSQCLLHTQP